MPGPNFVLDKGFEAQTAITEFFAVKAGTGEESCTAVTGTTDLVLGIAQQACTTERAALGQVIGVRLLGISRAVAQAQIARGVRVKVHSDGRLLTAASGVGTKENIVGISMTAAGAENAQFDVLLTPGVVNTTET